MGRQDGFQTLSALVKAPSAEASSPPTVEYRFLEWFQTGNVWYPKHIEIRQNTITTDDIQVVSTTLDSPVALEVFSIGKHMAEAGALKVSEEPDPSSTGEVERRRPQGRGYKTRARQPPPP